LNGETDLIGVLAHDFNGDPSFRKVISLNNRTSVRLAAC
jgi:hypothetical protein